MTTLLNITDVSASQSQKEVTINEGLEALANAGNAVSSVLVADVTSLQVQNLDPTYIFDRSAVLTLDPDASPPSAAFTLEVPASARLFGVINNTLQEATIEVDPDSDGPDGTTVVIPAGENRLISSDGANLVSLGGGSGGGGGSTAPAVLALAVSDEATPITVGTSKITYRMPFAMTVTSVRASLTTASTTGGVIVDVNEGGSSILSTEISVDATETTSTTSGTPAVISDSALADDAEITIDIDDAGSSADAAGLKVYIIGTAA